MKTCLVSSSQCGWDLDVDLVVPTSFLHLVSQCWFIVSETKELRLYFKFFFSVSPHSLPHTVAANAQMTSVHFSSSSRIFWPLEDSVLLKPVCPEVTCNVTLFTHTKQDTPLSSWAFTLLPSLTCLRKWSSAATSVRTRRASETDKETRRKHIEESAGVSGEFCWHSAWDKDLLQASDVWNLEQQNEKLGKKCVEQCLLVW